MSLAFEDLPPMRLAAVRHTGPYQAIGAAFETLGRVAAQAGLFALPGATMLGAYYDDPGAVPPDKLRSMAAVVVPKDAAIPGGLEEAFLNGGTYARFTHIGSFEGLPKAWDRFARELLPASGRTPLPEPALEVYRSDMTTTPVEKLHTDLYMRVA